MQIHKWGRWRGLGGGGGDRRGLVALFTLLSILRCGRGFRGCLPVSAGVGDGSIFRSGCRGALSTLQVFALGHWRRRQSIVLGPTSSNWGDLSVICSSYYLLPLSFHILERETRLATLPPKNQRSSSNRRSISFLTRVVLPGGVCGQTLP